MPPYAPTYTFPDPLSRGDSSRSQDRDLLSLSPFFPPSRLLWVRVRGGRVEIRLFGPFVFGGDSCSTPVPLQSPSVNFSCISNVGVYTPLRSPACVSSFPADERCEVDREITTPRTPPLTLPPCRLLTLLRRTGTANIGGQAASNFGTLRTLFAQSRDSFLKYQRRPVEATPDTPTF